MIPADFIVEWREHAPWVQSSQVEQDLVISRALVEIFASADVAGALAFRGGTALYKLHLPRPARYSEDIDLVQTSPGPIGETLDALRARMDSWLGEPRRSFKEGRVTLVYRFDSEDASSLPLRLKIEINSREHFNVLGSHRATFEVRSRWFSGRVGIPTYSLDELLGTKLRALYQRRKGRDLFDLWWAQQHAEVDPLRIVECFARYLAHEGLRVSRAEFEANLARKLDHRAFAEDLEPLLAVGTVWDAAEAARYVRDELLTRLSDTSWTDSRGSA